MTNIENFEYKEMCTIKSFISSAPKLILKNILRNLSDSELSKHRMNNSWLGIYA